MLIFWFFRGHPRFLQKVYWANCHMSHLFSLTVSLKHEKIEKLRLTPLVVLVSNENQSNTILSLRVRILSRATIGLGLNELKLPPFSGGYPPPLRGCHPLKKGGVSTKKDRLYGQKMGEFRFINRPRTVDLAEAKRLSRCCNGIRLTVFIAGPIGTPEHISTSPVTGPLFEGPILSNPGSYSLDVPDN